MRTRLRDASRSVRTDAAWNSWGTIHKIAKGLQERLTTPEDVEAERQEWVHAFAQRCAEAYPTADRLGDLNDPDRRAEIAFTLGLTGDFDGPDAEVQLDEVLAVYRNQYAQPATPAISPDIA